MDESFDGAKIYRVLANDTRREILELLREPLKHFDNDKYLGYGLAIEGGICVQDIQRSLNISQSVASTYLKSMQDAGLLLSYRAGRWTYYRRDEKGIGAFSDWVRKTL
ncbi:transcriptional regulator, ArsR family [Renibacterium salmoninarum ATCC 33209]|uniref:Transcriptional regulator, ArsR family n=1 Tax=Renibacterium salmoninarum (strain ATCC 33209 / DSM 20767 / JCM 11484 / NBRC 15589 / NCIMB 2235) TaxID=288705 RepID=A9WUK7_RENSM|nr:metalloregulator ArsR/SmtB family transcription factor [Renibacterium salmoninarum]ABY24878.1 transcriptional regulator, ArsR family [Renibacterium salmoninarum ATCC 33209]